MTRHTSPGPAFLDALSARLGPGRVSSDASDLAGHLVEERKLYRGQALALVRMPPGKPVPLPPEWGSRFAHLKAPRTRP